MLNRVRVLARRTCQSMLAVGTFFAASCATSSGPNTEIAGAAQVVIVDGKRVTAAHGTLLDFVRASPKGIVVSAGTPDGDPLLIIDGLRQRGTAARLAEISVNAVKRVTILRPAEAFVAYGQDGVNGAIVVETLQRRGPGTPGVRTP